MQNLAKTSLGGTVYTAAQVTAQLLAPVVQEDWKFYRLNSDASRQLTDISGYIDHGSPPEIIFDATATIMRTLKIPRIDGGVPLDPMADIIEPHYLLYMPDGTPVDWTLGRFTLTPGEKSISPGSTYLALDGADYGQLLTDVAFNGAYGVATGTNYVGAITAIIAGYGGAIPIEVRILDLGKTLPASLGWEAGTPLLKAINDLLQAMGYEPAWFDELGVLRSSPLIDFTQQQTAFRFETTPGKCVVKSPIRSKPDLAKAFNDCTVIGEDPRRLATKGRYINNSPDSRVSTVRWHTKTKIIKDSKMTDDAACYARAKSEVQAAARIYEPVTVLSMPWAFWQYRDVAALAYTTTDEGAVSAQHVVERWTHRCAAGVDTEHRVVRVVAA